MSGSPYQALELALALLRAPAQVALIRQRPLPPDVLTLIRLAVGDAGTLAAAEAASGEPPERLTEAAALFLQQVLFAADADSYRVLGVTPDAPQDLIKTHHHWLVRWLHPDRRPDDWETVYMNRVNRAWQNLRTLEQRRTYDATRTATPAVSVAIAVPAQTPLRPVRTRPTYLSAHVVRHLPVYVLSGIAAVAVAGLGLQYWAQMMPVSTPIAVAPTLPSGRPPPVILAGDANRSLSRSSPPPPAADRPAPAPRQPTATPPPAPSAPTSLAQTAGSVPKTHRPPVRLARIDTPRLPDPPPAAGLPAESIRRVKQPPIASPSAADRPAPASRQPTATPPPAPPAPTSLAQTAGSVPGAPPQTSTLALAVQVEAAATTAPPLEHAARALPQRLEDAYRRGDLAALLLLFAPDIQTEHGGYVPTAGVYRTLFATSLRREITLRHIDWQFDQANHATGRGQFEIAVVPRSGTVPRRAHGVILFDVVGHLDGRARLAGLRFEGDS